MGALIGRRTALGVDRTASHQEGRAASLPHGRGQVMWLLTIGLVLVVTRWALLPGYLISFDEINFALAVDRFDPRLAQPQPPGYPVFVALLKLVALFVPKIEIVFLIAGLIVSAASIFLLWHLCERIAGPNGGIIGALLLLLNPAFWLAGLTNPVRLCFAAGAIGVALCIWFAWQRTSAKWLAIAAAGLGLCAGARPSLSLVMGPLILWTAWRMRVGRSVAALAFLCFCAAVAVWLPGLMVASGGSQQFFGMLQSYSDQQMGGTSFLFGAPLRDALYMA